MKRLLIIMLSALTCVATVCAQTSNPPTTVKKERNHIRAGNKMFHDKRYADAEVEYRKALQEAPQSEAARFNLATALLMQGGGTTGQDEKNDPIKEATDLLTSLAKDAPSRPMRAKANYDLGNIAFAAQQYAQAIELYKQALRLDPTDNQARYNLRMAQLKQQNQQQNQDKNKNQQNQDKQDQDKNQDQKNQDKNKDQDKQGQDQSQNNQDRQNADNRQDNRGQQQPGSMSRQNAEQVLKTMQNQENATQQRINAEQARQQQRERMRTNRKW